MAKIFWTQHSKVKMRQYGLSKSKLISLVDKPERKEKGIVVGTVAVMKTNKIFLKEKKISVKKAFYQPKKAAGEVWLMYKDVKDQRKVISAWRYPGMSKPGDPLPIPEDIRKELLKDLMD